MLVVRDGASMTFMGRPFTPYLSLGVFLSRSIDLGSPMVSPGGDPVVWVFSSTAWEGGGLPVSGHALVPAPDVMWLGYGPPLPHAGRRNQSVTMRRRLSASLGRT